MAEEILLERLQHPDLPEHQALHNRITQEMIQAEAKLASRSLPPTPTYIDPILTRLIDHLLKDDATHSDLIQSGGSIQPFVFANGICPKIGIPTLDGDHQNLLWSVDCLHEAVLENRDSEEFPFLVPRIQKYALDHFQAESAFMAMAEYPEIIEHEAAHQALIERLEDFQSRFISGVSGLSRELLTYFRKWMTDHVQEKDRPMARYLKTFGRSREIQREGPASF